MTHLRASVEVIVNIEYKYLTFWKLLAMNKSERCNDNEFLKDRPSVIFFSSLHSADILKGPLIKKEFLYSQGPAKTGLAIS